MRSSGETQDCGALNSTAKERNEDGDDVRSPKVEDFWGRAALECNRIYELKH